MSALLSLSDLNTTVNHEPRVPDLLLAQRLGFDRPRKARDLIERNRVEIETYGPLASIGATTHGGTRPTAGREFFLNEGQALLICALSRTPKAAEVRRALIEVFMAWRRGQLEAPAPTKTIAAHTRRIAVGRDAPVKLAALIARLEAATSRLAPVEPASTPDKMRDGMAVIWLGGRRYLVDFADWELPVGARCLVIDGAKIVATHINAVNDPSPLYPRMGLFRAKDGVRDVAILGRIVTEAAIP